MPSPAIEKVTMGTADPYPVGTPIDQAVAFLGEGKVKTVVTGIYMGWISCIAIVQYTHPWTGAPPEKFMDMPMPLVLIILGLCTFGLFLEQKSKRD